MFYRILYQCTFVEVSSSEWLAVAVAGDMRWGVWVGDGCGGRGREASPLSVVS